MSRRRERSAEPSAKPSRWPTWAMVATSCALVFHLVAVISGGLAVPPSSTLERSVADLFTPYYGLADLGYAYRFYVEPPPTPVITATLQFGEDRPAETIRIPGREVSGPRMRHQRQLALANAVFMDFQEAKQRTGDGSRSLLARACAAPLLGPSGMSGGDHPCAASFDSGDGPGASGKRGTGCRAV